MGAQIREYRQRIRSVKATKKITRAMELMAASRVVKAQQAVRASTPYADAIARAVSALTYHSQHQHPHTQERDEVDRAGVVVITSDRGLAGAYSSSIIKEAERLIHRLQDEGKTPVLYLVGRKAISYFSFRHREYVASWEGFSEKPTFANAKEIADRILADFNDVEDDDDAGTIDEFHIVYTRFETMVTQQPQIIRLLPIEVVEGVSRPEEGEMMPFYDFEPNADEALDALMPKYMYARIFNCLLMAAASELAARQRAMKSATDNAEELIKKFTRLANQARQAEITQEISEIVGGANALAEAK